MFRELIQCGAVPVTVLIRFSVREKGSLIAANAYKMLNNSAALEYGEDFVFLPADNAECAAEIVEREYRRMTAELGNRSGSGADALSEERCGQCQRFE
ncbi:MAG: hypothetical protein ACLSHX_17805 [Suilimivivens sp.]